MSGTVNYRGPGGAAIGEPDALWGMQRLLARPAGTRSGCCVTPDCRGMTMYYGERFNSGTHLMGALLAAAGAAVLVVLAARLGDPWKIVSFSIYGFMLFALYALSTLYHLSLIHISE